MYLNLEKRLWNGAQVNKISKHNLKLLYRATATWETRKVAPLHHVITKRCTVLYRLITKRQKCMNASFYRVITTRQKDMNVPLYRRITTRQNGMNVLLYRVSITRQKGMNVPLYRGITTRQKHMNVPLYRMVTMTKGCVYTILSCDSNKTERYECTFV